MFMAEAHEHTGGEEKKAEAEAEDRVDKEECFGSSLLKSMLHYVNRVIETTFFPKLHSGELELRALIPPSAGHCLFRINEPLRCLP